MRISVTGGRDSPTRISPLLTGDALAHEMPPRSFPSDNDLRSLNLHRKILLVVPNSHLAKEFL